MQKLTLQQRAVAVLFVLFLLLFPHFVPLPFFSYTLVCFGVGLYYLRWQKQNLAGLGLQKTGLTLKPLVIGLLSALLWVAFMRWGYIPFIFHFFKDMVPPYTEYDFIRNNPAKLLMVIVAAWVVGGFYEEVVFRGFILRTIQGQFPKPEKSFWVAGIITSVLFGLYHWQQGIFGVIPAVLGSLYWTYLFKRFGENLWYSIFSHAFYDTITLVMIYYGVFGK